MSHLPRSIPDVAGEDRAPLGGRTLEIRWTGTPSRRDDAARCGPPYTISLTIVDARHGVIEAWGAGDRPLIDRQPVSCAIVRDRDLLHVDALAEGRVILSATLCGEDLRYVRTPVLLEAGVKPGSCDPPRCSLVARQRDAAIA